uniref:Uncharacterized protein n=1 Tax=Oryza nivara TaxID=4536 RepID=A0A0E0J2G3_ORYNI
MLAALPSPSSVAPASPPPSILPDALSVLLIAAIAVLPHKRRFKDEQALVVGFASAIPVFADTAGNNPATRSSTADRSSLSTACPRAVGVQSQLAAATRFRLDTCLHAT